MNKNREKTVTGTNNDNITYNYFKIKNYKNYNSLPIHKIKLDF